MSWITCRNCGNTSERTTDGLCEDCEERLDKELDPGIFCRKCHVVPVKEQGDFCGECQAAEAEGNI